MSSDYSLNTIKKTDYTSYSNLTSMKANIGSPSFHSWQSGDKVDKHLASSALLSYLVDFIYGGIPKGEQKKSVWKKHTLMHT